MASYEKLSSMDRVFLDLEGPSSHMHVAATMILQSGPLRGPDGGVDIDKVRAYVASRLHMMPRYRQKLRFTPIDKQPIWVDDDRFRIEYHVRHSCLPRPGGERMLKRLSGRIMSQQLDRGKPLWELWVVEGVTDDTFAIISKTHHCMIDGVSGVDLMSVLLSPFEDEEPAEAPAWNPDPPPGDSEVFLNEVWQRAMTPFTVAGAACEAVRHPRRTAQEIGDSLAALGEAISGNFHRSSDTPFNREIGPHRRFDWIRFDLENIKAVKNALGGTVNDVVLATVTGALGRFLEQRGFPTSRQKEMELRAFCPVSVRSESERGTLGNRVSGMIVDLPVTERDPGARMDAISHFTHDLKESKQALGAEVLAAVSEWTTHTLLTMGARLATGTRVYNLVVTNVPGPQIPLYMQGARVLETYPMVPLFRTQALGIALFSYAGGLYWGFNSDWDLMPDLHSFVEAMQASFDELCKAAGINTRAQAGNGKSESMDEPVGDTPGDRPIHS